MTSTRAGVTAAGHLSTASASASREESTLQWQLAETQRQLRLMLQPSQPASAILHPLATPPLPSRKSFQQLVNRWKSSVQSFMEEAHALALDLPSREEREAGAAAPEGSGSTLSQRQSDATGKQQRLISLLRESSLHSTAISDAAQQLQQPALTAEAGDETYLEPLLNSCALVTPHQDTWPTSSLEEARQGLGCFVRACESMAKELGMETFAETHHSVGSEGDTRHLQTLTLAANILVVDVETGVERNKEGLWKPAIRLRLSYATDSATTQPRARDHRLAECIKVDLQAVADLLLGWKSDDCGPTDCISATVRHYNRVRRTLGALKQLDDLSRGLKSVPGDALVPDLFAAMEDVSNQVHSSAGGTDAEQVRSRFGLPLQHVGWPYTCLAYHLSPTSSVQEKADVAKQADRQSLGLERPETASLHCLSITIASSSPRRASASSTFPELRSEGDSIDGEELHYVALLHPPVVMPRWVAHRLGKAVGVATREERRTKPPFEAHLAPAPSFEQMPASMRNGVVDGDSKLQFATRLTMDRDTRRQGTVVSRFAFSTLEELERGVGVLRRQARLNDLLCQVSANTELPMSEEKEPSLESILDGQSDPLWTGMERWTVSLPEDEEMVAARIVVNVPLSVDCWTLEVTITQREGKGCSLDARVCELGQAQKPTVLDHQSSVYKRGGELLNKKGGKGLMEVLELVRGWAMEVIKPAENRPDENGDSRGSPDVTPRETKSKSTGVASEVSPTSRSTRRRSSGQSNAEDKEAATAAGGQGNHGKRRASQASMDENESSRRTSQRKS